MPPKKKRKVDEGPLDNSFQWQLEEKPNSWVIYDDETQKALTQAFNNKEEECEIEGGDFVVLLIKPCQKTKATGYQKRVRIGKVDKKQDKVVTWSWEDGRKKRHYYSVQSMIDLEDDKNYSTLDVQSEGKTYNVDVKNMKHGNKYKMFRDVADAKAALTDKAAASSTSDKAKKVAGKAAADLKTKGEKLTTKEAKEKIVEKTILKKGKVPVDPECPLKESMHVYCSGEDIWDCMLNQTYMQNNNNKYYIIQLLEADSLNKYTVWTRWGRVGKAGQTADYPCGPTLEEAKRVFCNKFRDKTKNDWYKRKNFTKVSGKYDLLEMDYDAGAEDTDTDAIDSAKAEPADIPDCKLDQRVQDLITLIADVRAMEAAVVEMKYDAKKAPLGKLTKAQIKQGYSALKDIETLIKAGKFGSELTEACNAFYTRIPHDFGMKPPERIVSLEILKAKMDLLEALGDIEIAVNVLKKGDQNIHPIDRKYLSLECDLEPMDKSCDVYKVLKSYLLNTHASTHNQYSIELLDIFHCDKDQPSGPDVGNKMLLWHGSRLTNWVGILAKGLRIAPPEAPVTGYMFGKGVYFADCSSKSANYCFPSKTKNVGLLLLNEVTLGQQNELISSNYHADKLPKGKHSVKGCGKMAPNPDGNTDLDGVTVPCGKLKETGTVNSSGYTLQYNEYIVYNTNQIKMKYLLKVKFNFRY